MKPSIHFFVVHSGISFLCFDAVRKYLNIPEDQVRVLAGRGFASSGRLSRYRTVDSICFPLPGRGRSPVGALKRRSSFTKSVGDLTNGRRFHLYIPHSITPEFRLLQVCSLCEGFSYLEEGTGVYLRSQSQSGFLNLTFPKQSLAERLIVGDISQIVSPFDPSATACYGFFPAAYAGFGLTGTILDRNWCDSAAQPERDSFEFLVLPPSIQLELGLWGKIQFAQMVEAMCEVLRQGSGRIHVRFHPNNDEADRSLVISAFQRCGREVTYSPASELGEHLLSGKIVRVYHFGSSLGVYASWLGHQVVYCGRLLDNQAGDVVRTWRLMSDSLVRPVTEETL